MAIAVEPEARQKAFYEKVEKQAFFPLWLVPNPDKPRCEVRPWLWPWSILRPNMLEACEVMGLGGDEGAERRVLTLVNPTLPPGQGAGPTRTLSCACQLVRPG
ncbi:MAG TPA: hypothetical protein VKU60_16865, partial [Chloroflexota bacterium]|nr:hypothetical protein [Chloroflexota bacterium]